MTRFPFDRAPAWQLPSGPLSSGPLPRLMGIVNVTPDSFFDGGRFLDVDQAVEHGLRLADAGADLLDVGGESTRPYAQPVDSQEELRRVLPVIRQLARQVDIPLSIDTSKVEVAEQALDAGAEVINDITGLTGDPRMAEVAVRRQAAVCVMHMRGTPQDMQDAPHYDDVMDEVLGYLRGRRDHLEQCGLRRGQICLDPGIGFGKSRDHNLTLLSGCQRLHQLGCSLLVGHSRKRFIRGALGNKDVDPLAGTIAVTLALAQRGVQVLRVHDVEAMRQALTLFEAAGGLQEVAAQQQS